jgi:hypothetical protein
MKWREFETKTLTLPNTFENWLRRLSACRLICLAMNFPVAADDVLRLKSQLSLNSKPWWLIKISDRSDRENG